MEECSQKRLLAADPEEEILYQPISGHHAGTKCFNSPDSSTIHLSGTEPGYRPLIEVMTTFGATPIITLKELIPKYVDGIGCTLLRHPFWSCNF